MKTKTTYLIIGILLLVGGYFLFINKTKEATLPDSQTNTDTSEYYQTFKSSEYGPEFTYPKLWGEVTVNEGNKICPEEDTYRTQDSLSIFEHEFGFKEIKLPNSESFIRTGVRIHELDSKKLNKCGDEFLYSLATKKIQPETLSSVRLVSVTSEGGLSGVYNAEASRLNTEGRRQYTFFLTGSLGKIYVLQSYMSFIPHFGSPELKELDKTFKGNMDQYLEKGNSSATIRNYFGEFIKMSQSLKFRGE